MGILTRRQGDKFVITSDRTVDASPSKRAPRWQAEVYQVWTGTAWSTTVAEAQNFDSLDEADEYVRVNMAKVLS